MKVKIYEDLFDVSNRIKKVDDGYFFMFNKNLGEYELHNSKQKKNTFCFNVGKKLNSYAIIKAQKTSIKYLKRTLKQIDEHNAILENKKQEEIIYKAKTDLMGYLNYL